VLFTTAAWAAPKRIGVPKFDGVQEALVRKKVMQILKSHGYDLAKSREMEIGLANTGALLDNDEGFQKVAKELALAAIVTGEIGKKRAKIAIHDGKDGSLLGEAAFAGANPRAIMAEVGRSFWTKLGGEIERGKTPSGSKKPQKVVAEAPEDDEKTPDVSGEGGGQEAPPPPPPKKKKNEEPVAEAEGGGEGEEPPPPPKKKKKKKQQLRMEKDVVEEEGPEVIPPTFDAQVGVGFINRVLAYHEDASTPGLRSYGLPAGPSLQANIIWYPIGPFTDGPLKNLGFEANFELGVLISSSLKADPNCAMGGAPPADCFPNGAKFTTSVHEFSGGARYRMPFGGGHSFYASLTGGEHAFTFHTDNTSDATMSRGRLLIPDTIYRFIRPGIGMHFEMPAQISLTLSGGFRYVFNNGGQFHDYFFPYSTVNGVDAQAAIGYRITPTFEARLVGDFRRYFSSMNCAASGPSGTTVNRCDATSSIHPNQNFTAGGAIDQYINVYAVIAVTMGGTDIVMPEEAEEPPPPPKRKRKAQSEDEEPGAGDSGGGGDEQ